MFGDFCRWPLRLQNLFPILQTHELIHTHLNDFRKCMEKKNWGLAADSLSYAQSSVEDMKMLRDIVAHAHLANFEGCVATYEELIAENKAFLDDTEKSVITMSLFVLGQLKAAVETEDLDELAILITSAKTIVKISGVNFTHDAVPCAQLKKSVYAAEEFYTAARARAGSARTKKARIV